MQQKGKPLLSGDSVKVSVVMPTFNQAPFIEDALLSVLDQDYGNLELIVIDGGSTDGTLEVLERYRSRLAHYVSEPDQGQSDALNKGFRLASGAVYGWLNSDDVYCPGAIRKAVGALMSSPTKSVVYGDWLEIDERGAVLQPQFAFDFSLAHFIYEGFHINAQSMFWRAEAHAMFGEFDTKLHRTMDYQLILGLGTALGQSAFIRLPERLGCFRRHADQKTGPGGRDVVEDEHRRIAARYGCSDKFLWRGRLLRMVYRFRRAWWYAYRGGIGYLIRQVAQPLGRQFRS